MSGSVTIEYAKVATYDNDHESLLPAHNASAPADEDNPHSGMVHAIRNDNPFPISKPPTKYRDATYGVLFVVHLLGIMLLTLIEKTSLEHAVLNYGRAGSWASIVMSLTLLSTVCGGVLFFVLKQPEARAALIMHGTAFSLILKVCMGNILLIIQSHFSFLGVFILLSALLDVQRLRPARTSLAFTSALMQLALDVDAVYGIGLAIACVGIVAAQTCVLLWWGSFYIGLLATMSPGPALALLSALMAFSLYWTAQVFHHFLGFLVGGCTLYYFVKPDSDPLGSSSSSSRSSRILLYLKCGLSTSFGSLCKAALFIMPAQFVLLCSAWFSANVSQGSCCYRIWQCLGGANGCGCGLSDWARRYSKLTVCSLAVYGRTLFRTADDQLTYYPGTLRTSQEDYTSYSLGCISTCVAGVISIVFGLLAESKALYSWPLFFSLCFYLTYFGVSLTLHAYSSAVDAFIVAAAINPDRFAVENQLVLLRFMRTGDPDLQQ